jgi:protease PrsW
MDRMTVIAPTGHPRRHWLHVLLAGLALWVATVLVTLLTKNVNLIPTIVLLGSFLVPVTFVLWAFGRRDTGEITAELLFSTFITGGVLGVLGASVLESYLLSPSPWLFIGVGLIEEAVKLAALALLTRHLHHKTMRDGIILGSAVGFGFAAFESAGYAFTALFTTHGLSLLQVVETEILRGLLAPVGHGLWTGILGGVLFSDSTRDYFKIGIRLVLTYLGVSLLHALWDSMQEIAIILTLLFVPGGSVAGNGTLSLTPTQVDLVPVLDWGGMAVVALIGIGWLLLEWRASRRRAPVTSGWRMPIAQRY